MVGRWIDRYGAGTVLAVASAIVGVCGLGLSQVVNLGGYYGLFVPGRACFAAPLELAPSTAISNWFIRRRPLALAILMGTQGTGLAAMPLVAQWIIGGWGWRAAWSALGIYTLAIGVIPALLLIRRPEDVGLAGDPMLRGSGPRNLAASYSRNADQGVEEPDFTTRQALRTRSFWILSVFSAAIFLVQGGVSVHQAAHFIDQGVPGSSAALIVGVFALSQVAGGLVWSTLASRVPVQFLLASSGMVVALGGAITGFSGTFVWGICSAATLGVGIGGIHLLLRLVWADFYGRSSLGSIRGVTLPVQIAGQLTGPLIAGFMFDATGAYRTAFILVAATAALASVMVLAATPPKKPVESLSQNSS
jgi:MFS family permease